MNPCVMNVFSVETTFCLEIGLKLFVNVAYNGLPTEMYNKVVHDLCYILNPLLHRYSLIRINKTAFENIVEKEEIARNEQFLLFLQCLLLNKKIVSPFVNIFDIISFFASELEEPKIGM